MSQKRSSEGPLTPSKQAKLTAGIPVTLGLSGQVVATTDAGLSPSAASLSPAPPTIPSLLTLSSTQPLRPSQTSGSSSVYLPINLASAAAGGGGGAFPPVTPTGPAPMHLISPPPYPSSSAGDGYMSPSQFLCSPTAFKPPDILASSLEQYDQGLAGFNTEDTENLQGEKLRRYLIQRVITSLGELKARYSDYLKEKFFLLNSGAMVDLLQWKKRPNVHLSDYLTAHRLDDVEAEGESTTPTVTAGDRPSQGRVVSSEAPLLQFGSASALAAATSTGTTASTIGLTPSQRSIILPPTSRITTRIRSFTTVYDKSHEDIVLRARHEAEVMKAIAELRREGLWSASRLPKVMEPVRRKTHWDYLLEEMQWLATDFANERRWKRGAARKMVRSVLRHHQEAIARKEQQGRDERQKLKKIANTIAKEVKQFWDSINRLAQHKQQMVLEAKCKKALDMHLSFIVDQTEKYSTWLVKDFAEKPSAAGLGGDESFIPQEASEDEEETIEKEEKEAGELDYSEEIAALERESMLPIEELLAGLPQEMLEEDAKVSQEKAVDVEDEDFRMEEAGDAEDEEGTIEEQEGAEGGLDHRAELEELQQEGDLSLEELMAKYGYVSQEQGEDTCDSSDEDSAVCSEGEGEDGEDLSKMVEAEEDGALHMLVSGKNFDETEPGLTDIAAEAELLQPKGTSLATTEVRTPVPFLLRHKLRDYQHIGLEWLVMMHERKLNGILADEMGLGKTIQTIAVLAHVACEQGVWGPHLIVVPTSVLLNWEFEFKKWCPGFKILTYFGSTKERKQLRVGWTKPNAFHVCITSYNLAVKDHRVFKQKKWRYLVLDEAQNIKNFKSQRWQTLLSFNSQRRLLLTGTPLQNSVMELWSLMHFLMPSVFSSHTDFKEWFSNPLTGMVEGSQEYSETIVRRLHKVLRPFLLRRLKSEVEKQMPQKFEHTVMCRLSTRQRFLYEEYMSRTKTKETLSTGNFLSVINILMQLRKVCNHPDLFEPRPIVSSFVSAGIVYTTASMVLRAMQEDSFERVGLDFLNLRLIDYEESMDAFAGFRVHHLQPAPTSLREACLQRPTQTEGETTATAFLVEELRLPELEARVEEEQRNVAEGIVRVNSWRCQRGPVYGRDLHQAFTIAKRPTVDERRKTQSSWLWCGRDACQQAVAGSVWEQFTHALRHAVKTVRQRAVECEDLLSRFIMTVPKVTSPVIDLHVCHPPPLWQQRRSRIEVVLKTQLTQPCDLLHPVATRMSFQFPETRLIQYDCGKLQTLDHLLSQLKAGGHRVLIFSQMARMLNVLEIFLNYHGYTYLRLDGSTPVQRRQILMERFNRDERVFCFILSTRSGGLGVNLTGADTVVFYDSDWNPTMDAQAQDRCHRIGQTRDVHIYRLVCEGTVEENVLKKANQKRMLGELAIESGAFTTEFFTEGNIRELFSSDESVSTTAEKVPEVVETAKKEEEEAMEVSDKSIEQMLAQVEDESDVKAASRAKQEQVAELAEFDESFLETAGPLDKDPEESKVAMELAALEEQLSGVEKFALRFVETQNAAKHAEQLRMAERDIEQAKKNWELGHLQSLKEEEERLAEEEFNNIMLTYDRPETVGKVYLDDETLQEMPIWYPPTPPIDDNDLYMDYALDMWYDLTGPMEEALLPPIDTSMDYDVFGLLSHKGYLKGNKKSLLKSQHKKSKDRVTVTSTLFWKRSQAESLAARLKKLAVIPTKKVKSKDQLIPLVDTTQERVDWSVMEDWIVLRTITHIHELNIHLTIVSPAQIPNFHMISDLVTAYGKTVRSTQQCRDHFISVIHPREESKQQEETEVKIKQRDGTVRKVKVSKSHRTKGLVVSDGGMDTTRHYSGVFDTLMDIGKKAQPPKFMESTSTGVSQVAVLLEYGIKYDDPQSPSVLSLQRAERIQAEKTAELSKQTQMMNQQLLGATPYGVPQVGTTSASAAAALKGTYPSVTAAVSNAGWSATPGQTQAPPRTVGPLSWKPAPGHLTQGTSVSSVGSAIPRASFATHLALTAKMQSLQAAQPQPMDADGGRTVRKLSSDQPSSHQESTLPASLVPTPLSSHINLSGLSQTSRSLTSAPVSLVAKAPTASDAATHAVQPQLTQQQQMMLMQRLHSQQLLKAHQAKRMTQQLQTSGGVSHSATKAGLTPSVATSHLVTTLAKQRNVTEDVIALLKQHQQQQMQQQQVQQPGQVRTVSITPGLALSGSTTAQQQLALQKQLQGRAATEGMHSLATSSAPPLASPTLRTALGLPGNTTVAPLSSFITGQSSTSEQGAISVQTLLDSQAQLSSQPANPGVILSPQASAKLAATSPLIQPGQSVTQTFKLQQGVAGKALTQVATSAYPANSSQNKPAAPQDIQQAHFTLKQLLRVQLEAVTHQVAQQQQQQVSQGTATPSPTQMQPTVPVTGTAAVAVSQSLPQTLSTPPPTIMLGNPMQTTTEPKTPTKEAQ